MTTPFCITADHTGFYQSGIKVFPKIQDAPFPLLIWSNAALLNLSASLKDDLDWSLQKKNAVQLIEANKSILFELDFQFRPHDLISNDSSIFFAHARALEEFTVFCSAFAQQTLGVCLYRNNLKDLIRYSDWEEPFLEWLKEFAESSYAEHELRNLLVDELTKEHYFHLFSADLFAAFLHKLISCLPDGIMPFACFDASAMATPAFAAQVFSKERFKYLHLGLNGAEFPFSGLTMGKGTLSCGWLGNQDIETDIYEAPPLAICFPSDAYCDRIILAKLDSLMATLRASHTVFRIIYEDALTEEWDGLDRLIVIPGSVSPQGKRKLQGFIAAGGEIVEYNTNHLREPLMRNLNSQEGVFKPIL